MKISPARIAAFEVLARIERDRSFSSILLPKYENGLSAPDRSLCHELVLGTLRRQIYLDRVIEQVSKGKRMDLAVRIALRLGTYQLLFLDRVPSHSAVNESVNLVQKAKKTSAKGFTNAILREIDRKPPALAFDGDVDRISVETSHPPWLIERWMAEFGPDAAEQIAQADNIKPRLAFRLIGNQAVNIDGAIPSDFVPGCYLIDNFPNDPAIFAASNNLYFQDEGSQMIANAIKVPDGGSFYEVCAAPGGKTAVVVTRNDVGLAVAGDVHWARVQMLRDNCRFQGADNVRILQYDAETCLPVADGAFDTVFVDAPCTGTGTIRHNPEIRYFIEAADIEVLSNKQLSILTSASKAVSHGGYLIYSTCSLEREENEQVCERFLSNYPEFSRAKPCVPEQFITADGYGRTFPHRDSMDGFFIAAMCRR
jgi:16S rRNA (cytosine967-C5)-methyltransferase